MTIIIFQEQYITIFLALYEIVKSPIKSMTATEFAAWAETMTTDKPANQSVLREEFQVRESGWMYDCVSKLLHDQVISRVSYWLSKLLHE